MRVVRVAGQGVGPARIDDAHGRFLRLGAEVAQQGAGRHLHLAAHVHEGLELAGVGHHGLVAFGVHQHRAHAQAHEVGHQFVGAQRNLPIGQLQQHVAALQAGTNEGEAALGQHVQRLGTGAHLGAALQVKRNVGLHQFGLKGREGLGDALGVVVEHTGIDVRCGHHRPDTVGHVGPRQGQCLFQGARAVVDARQNVAVDVDHAWALCLLASGNWRAGLP